MTTTCAVSEARTEQQQASLSRLAAYRTAVASAAQTAQVQALQFVRARPAEAALRGVALLVLAAQALLRWLACSKLSVHWDEFNFLRIVHAAHRGEAIARFQSLHARLFFWLPYLDWNEVDQIVLARQVMCLLNIAALAALAAAVRRFHGWTATLWSLCVVGGVSYVIQHACAFRYDGLLLLLYGGALWLLTRPSLRSATCAGLAIAVAPLVSLKSVLFAPPLALFSIFGRGDRSWHPPLRYLRRAAVSAALSFCLLAALHWWARGSGEAKSERAVGDYAQGMFGFRLPIHRYSILERTLEDDPSAWFLVLAGGVLLLAATLRPRADVRRSAALAFLAGAPLLSVLIYRNAWPYYVAGVLMVSVSWIATVPARWLSATRLPVRAGVVLGLLGFSMYSGLESYSWYLGINERLLGEQRRVIAAVKAIFPEPVPYIDRCGMLASFPKVNPFITTLTAGRYRARGVPRFEELLRRAQPPLLLVNINALDPSREWRSGAHALMRQDLALLSANFVPHWGPIWVAGKNLTLQAEEEASFEMLIGGTYTLEAEQPLSIDGRLVQPGQTVQLAQGPHAARAEHAGTARLRYGDHLARPAGKPASTALFEGFHANRPLKLF